MSLIQVENSSTRAALDVREIVPRERHSIILDAFAQLEPCRAFRALQA